MVSIIKNQLLKHLSRFTKNLSTDKINLSTFKGEGELTNLELDEKVLTDLLELPCWLRLTSAWCNKVTFRIQWTKLKSVPIQLNLDVININVETCEEFREYFPDGSGLTSYMSSPGKYSFINKVIDGISVYVHTVNITFQSPVFQATLQVSQIKVESVSPTFKQGDLRITRLKDPTKGELLIFKELVWQTMRIEAKSVTDPQLTPIRLLTNQARCRLIIKKRLSDCFVLGSRLVLILDDLLWVITDSQLKAALLFLGSLAGLIQKATDLSRKQKAARKLESLPEYHAQRFQQARKINEKSTISKIFSRYDIVETSYHFVAQRIDLHLCDDPGDGRSMHPHMNDGGALQISMIKLQLDFYPYHLAVGDRKHWALYNEINSPHTQWLNESLSVFRNRVLDLIEPFSNNDDTSHNSTNNHLNDENYNSKIGGATQQTSIKTYVLDQLSKLMMSCLVVRLHDFTVYKVTTTKNQQLREFITGDKDHYSLPNDMSILQAEFIHFYYPGDTVFPLPPQKFYVHMNPVHVNFDVDSCLWANSFLLHLHKTLLSAAASTNGGNESFENMLYIDVKIELIMPRIIFETTKDYPSQKDRPKSLQINISRALITNVRSSDSTKSDLAKCIDNLSLCTLFQTKEFPSTTTDSNVIHEKFLKHIHGTDKIRDTPKLVETDSIYNLVKQFKSTMFWTEAKDVWNIQLDPIWLDFYGSKSVGVNKAIPFVDSFPLNFWVYLNLGDKNKPMMKTEEQTGDKMSKPTVEDGTAGNIYCVAHISNLVSLQLNHYQLLFLLRLEEQLSEFSMYLNLDTSRILADESSSKIMLGVNLPQVEINLLMPAPFLGKESSGCDLESVIPDSSSIMDDFMTGSTHVNSLLHMDSTESRKITTFSSELCTTLNKEFLNESQLKKQNVSYVESTNLNGIKENGDLPRGEQHDILMPLKDNFDRNSSIPTSQNPLKLVSSMNVSKDINQGLSSMKSRFSSFMTSIDSALKTSVDDGSDTISIRSDMSSESDNYILVNMDEESQDAMFKLSPCDNFQNKINSVEIASEVIEDDENGTTSSEHSIVSCFKRRDVVSVTVLKLNKVEMIMESNNSSSAIKLQVFGLNLDECGTLPWDEFQQKFSSRSRAWNETFSNNNLYESPSVKLRLNHVLNNDVNLKEIVELTSDELLKLFSNNIEIKVTNVKLTSTASTLTGISDLLEDEIIREVVPLRINLENINLEIIEDKMSMNISSPAGANPIKLHINELYLFRNSSGVIIIEPKQKNSSNKIQNDINALNKEEMLNLNKIINKLSVDNESLKRQMQIYERIKDENHALRRSIEEMDNLRASLSHAQESTNKLLNEKEMLLEKIRDLQNKYERMACGAKR